MIWRIVSDRALPVAPRSMAGPVALGVVLWLGLVRVRGRLPAVPPGDIVGAKGFLFRTKKGELTVRVHELRLLVKSIRPLPEKFHGLADQEQRYRQRYVDLFANPEVRKSFALRSRIVREVRAYFDSLDYHEVETPILFKSTPEGAREFLVPNRREPGTFYALPQSPQQFKQIRHYTQPVV